ncbi:MerR family transcriptional regulator [Microbispora sp. CA-135349]|uniref:MerR family transcriptional regulator n=1 Tax=Microbispora sp. CA-135349 TaxID=3239953 RepID=UPI003D8EF551
MRIAELSRRADVSVPTIKFYLREGLLFPGERTSYNQAQYTEEHVRRLKVIRALIEVGGLSVAATRDVLEKMYAPGMSVIDSAGKAQFALTTPRPVIEDESWERALKETDALLDRLGWQVRASNPARQALASAVATLFRLGQTSQLKLLDEYAAAARRVAEAELALLATETDPDALVESAVIWTVLGDVVFSSLRRFAHEDVAYRSPGDDEERSGEPGGQGGGPTGSGR